MLNYLIKKNKNSVVVTIYKKDGRAERFYTIPERGAFSHNGRRYIIDKKTLTFEGNKAHFIYREDTALPIPVRDIRVKGKDGNVFPLESLSASAREFEVHKRDKTVTEMLNIAGGGVDAFKLLVFGAVMLVLVLGAMAYLGMEQFNSLNNQIRHLAEAIEMILEEANVDDFSD